MKSSPRHSPIRPPGEEKRISKEKSPSPLTVTVPVESRPSRNVQVLDEDEELGIIYNFNFLLETICILGNERC